MENRYTEIFRKENIPFIEGCFVKTEICVLQKDNLTGKLIAQIKFRNTQENDISSCVVQIKAFDVDGKEIESIGYDYSNLNAKKDEYFGSRTPVFFLNDKIVSIDTIINRVTCLNGSIWDKDKEIEYSTLLKQLENENDYIVFKGLYEQLNNLQYKDSKEQANNWLNKYNDLERAYNNECNKKKIINELDTSNTYISFIKSYKELENLQIEELEYLLRKYESKKEKLKQDYKKKQKKKTLIAIITTAILIVAGILFLIFKHNCERDGHVYGEWIVKKKATCISEGTEYKECKYCHQQKTEKIAKINHKLGTWVISKKATCTEDGLKLQRCTLCNQVINKETIQATGHNYKGDICQTCGFNKSACAKGHSASDWIVDVEATCTSEGKRHKVCTRCGVTTKTEKIAKKSHTVGEWIIDKECSCEEDGLKHQHCSVCNQDVNSTTIAGPGHTYINYECTVCHDKLDTTNWSQGLKIENGVVKGVGTCKDTNIVIPSYMADGTKVTSVGKSAFENRRGLTSITIPNSVTSIGNRAFYGCSSLTSITIPNSVTSIGEGAFEDCRGLTSITISNSVTSIGNRAFNDCSSLTSITIPNSVTSIGEWVFAGCRGLTSITIPNSVKSIGDFTFINLIVDITYQGTKKQWKAISKSYDWDYGWYGSIICKDGTITR